MKKVPLWVRPLLLSGAVLNLLLAAMFLLLPNTSYAVLFANADFLSPHSVMLFGILLAAFGVGYLAAGLQPLSQAVVLIMGLVANLLLALFFVVAAGNAFWAYTAIQLWTLLALGWCAVLISILYHVAKIKQAPQSLSHIYQEPLSKTLNRFRTQRGKSLLQLSNEQPILVIFLRHFGCTFCRETLADIHQQRAGIESQGTQLVLVHLVEEEEASAVLEKYELADLHRISDTNGIMYNAFDLPRGNFKQLFGWRSWVRGITAGLWKRHGLGPLQGDGFRMPGVFLISKGEIIRSYRHKYASQRPDYRELASDDQAA